MTAPLRALSHILLLLLLAAAPARALVIDEIGMAGGPGEDGESVHASGSESASGADPAQVIATASGGAGGAAPVEGGPAGDGGGAGLGPLYASSDTGDVVVSGTAHGGNGGNGTADQSAGDGAAVRLFGSLDGDTAGSLTLDQTAWGGNAGYPSGGRAGTAVSHLTRSKAAQSFALTSRAIGGGAATTPLRTLGAAEGAPARATGSGVNTAGEMRTLVFARGGLGGSNANEPGGDGGDATAFASGRSEGDGHPVSVGRQLLFPLPTATADTPATLGGAPGANLFGPIAFLLPGVGATGGDGGRFLSITLPPVTPPGGDGGDARSTSVGIAAGDSPVDVLDIARGGTGGFQVGVAPGTSSEGGKARSVAVGVGGGSSPVEVEARATGGGAGSVGQPADPSGESFLAPRDGQPGGRAQASAVAIGRGDADASASASGGVGTGAGATDPHHPGGPGQALAKAIGEHGAASAAAKSSSEALYVEARAGAELPGQASSEARIGPARPGQAAFRRLGHYFGGRNASVEATVSPGARQVARALRREGELAQALEDAGVEAVDALGTFSAWQRGPRARGGAEQVSVLEVELSSLALLFNGVTDPVYIGLFAPQLAQRGFVGLHLTLENGEDLLADESFARAAAARAFLDGALLEVGPIETGPFPAPPPPSRLAGKALLRIELVTRAPGAGMALDFLVGTAPPEEPVAP
jgi:hypothetical protein